MVGTTVKEEIKKGDVSSIGSGSITYADKKTSDEKIKRINEIVVDLFQKSQELAKDNPEEALRLYKKAEYLALSNGKSIVGRTYVKGGQFFGIVSFESELNKEKSKLDIIVKNYKKANSEIEKEESHVSKKIDELKSKKDKSYELEDLVESQIKCEEQKIIDKNSKYQTMKKESYNKDTINEMQKLRDESRSIKVYINKLGDHQTENAIYHRNIENELNETEEQSSHLRDQKDKIKVDMYNVMQKQTPTIYLMKNIKSWRITHQTSNDAIKVGNKINKLSILAKIASANLEASIYEQSPLDINGNGRTEDYGALKKSEEARIHFSGIKKDILDRFKESRQIYNQTDTLL